MLFRSKLPNNNPYTGYLSGTLESSTGRTVWTGLFIGPNLSIPVKDAGTYTLTVSNALSPAGVAKQQFVLASSDVSLGALVLAPPTRFTSAANTLIADRPTVAIGSSVGFRASWQNGGADITSAVVRFSIPPGSSLVSNSVALDSVAVADANVTVTGSPGALRTATVQLGTLANGAKRSLRYLLSVDAAADITRLTTRVEIGKDSSFEALPVASVSVLGLTLLALGLGAVSLGIVQGPVWGWTGVRVLGCLLVALACGIVVARRTRRHPVPAIDPDFGDIYSIEVADRGEISFTQEEAKDSINLTLG